MPKTPKGPADPLAPLSGYVVVSPIWRSDKDHWIPGIMSMADAKSLVAYWQQGFMPQEVRNTPHRIVKVTVTFEVVEEN